MTVVAKFFVSELIQHDGSPTADRVRLGAVCRGAQNAKWASATPSGSIELGILNDAATAYFVAGEEYEVTFTHAPKPVPMDGHSPAPEYAGWNKDHSKPPNMCGICGIYGQEQDDGTIDWAGHLEHYGA